MIRTDSIVSGGTPIHVLQADVWDLPEFVKRSFAHVMNHRSHTDWLGEVGNSSTDWWRRYWCGVKSRAEVDALLERGWPDGVNRLAGMVEQLRGKVTEPVAQRRQQRWMDEGDEIDIHRVYAGQLDAAWRRAVRVPRPAPRTISVDVTIGGNNHLTRDQMLWSGAAAVVLTDVLEDAGYRVELNASFSARMSNDALTLTRWRMKEASEPARTDTLAAVCAHGAVYRVYGLLSLTWAPAPTGCDFGRAIPTARALGAAYRAGLVDKCEVQIAHAYSEQAATETIVAALESIGTDESSS